MRIFVPKYPLIYTFLDYIPFFKKRIFAIKNIGLLANDGVTKGLEFEVSPKAEWLVGKCYQDEVIILDDNLVISKSLSNSLKSIQKIKIANFKWCICCPIFDNNDKIIAIIDLDGTHPITIKDEKVNELSDFLYTYLTRIYEVVPHLFKDKV